MGNEVSESAGNGVVRVGIVGLGMMGCTHLAAYLKIEKAEVVAICDANPKRLSGEEVAAGNIEGQAEGDVAQLEGVARYTTVEELLADDNVDLVDICLPTDMHLDCGLAALEAGKHVCMEKPLARTADEADKMAQAAEQSEKLTFVAHCMRFWPGWTWLKDAVDDGRYGAVKGATFRRVASHPGGFFLDGERAGGFFLDGERAGGAILDLHIHDADFIRFVFGEPKAVHTSGYTLKTGAPDHVVTVYDYPDIPLVVAEGGWVMADGFGFSMAYTVNFEKATAVFDLANESPLKVYADGEAETIELEDAMGYDLELEHFVKCVLYNTPSDLVSWKDAAVTVRLIEAELASLNSRG
jgi:predicted dehydrogenase